MCHSERPKGAKNLAVSDVRLRLTTRFFGASRLRMTARGTDMQKVVHEVIEILQRLAPQNDKLALQYQQRH